MRKERPLALAGAASVFFVLACLFYRAILRPAHHPYHYIFASADTQSQKNLCMLFPSTKSMIPSALEEMFAEGL